MDDGSVPLSVRVWGDLACYTRPEAKVERVSYSVMTPSAARGVLESIFWKPEFSWVIENIWVLRPIRHFSISRNEIKGRQSVRSAEDWSRNGGGYDAMSDHTPRHTLALRDVAYVIHARIVLRPHANAEVAKYRDQFRRRVEAGRCFQRPYLGMREFAAAFAPVDGSEHPIDLSDDLGLMLHDIDYAPDGSGRGSPRFFIARLDRGVLHVPKPLEYGRDAAK